MNSINKTINCHHLIFAWNQHKRTGDAAKKIRLLGDSPVGANYIFTNHSDNNSNSIWTSKKAKSEVIDMFGMFMDRGIVSYNYDGKNNLVKWHGKKHTVKLGAFYNRIGVD